MLCRSDTIRAPGYERTTVAVPVLEVTGDRAGCYGHESLVSEPPLDVVLQPGEAGALVGFIRD